jgi:hypothetical protein
VATVAARRPTLLGQLAALRKPRAGRRSKTLAAKLAIAAREHLTTVCALAAIDLGAFEACHPAGFIVGGLSLLVAEWKIRG